MQAEKKREGGGEREETKVRVVKIEIHHIRVRGYSQR